MEKDAFVFFFFLPTKSVIFESVLTFDLKDTQQYGAKFLGPHFNFPIGQK